MKETSLIIEVVVISFLDHVLHVIVHVINQHILIVIVIKHAIAAIHQVLILVVVIIQHELICEGIAAHVLLLLHLLLLRVVVALIVILLLGLLLLLVQLRHRLLGLQVRVERDQLFPHLRDHRDLLLQEGVQIGDILLDVGAGLVHLVEEGHLLLDEVHHVVDVPAVARNDLLFLLQDLFDKLLML